MYVAVIPVRSAHTSLLHYKIYRDECECTQCSVEKFRVSVYRLDCFELFLYVGSNKRCRQYVRIIPDSGEYNEYR